MMMDEYLNNLVMKNNALCRAIAMIRIATSSYQSTQIDAFAYIYNNIFLTHASRAHFSALFFHPKKMTFATRAKSRH